MPHREKTWPEKGQDKVAWDYLFGKARTLQKVQKMIKKLGNARKAKKCRTKENLIKERLGKVIAVHRKVAIQFMKDCICKCLPLKYAEKNVIKG